MGRDELARTDCGKRVVDADGTVIGRLVAVRDGRGYVRQAWSIRGAIRVRLGLQRDLSRAHPLDGGSVARITEDAVHLRGRF